MKYAQRFRLGDDMKVWKLKLVAAHTVRIVASSQKADIRRPMTTVCRRWCQQVSVASAAVVATCRCTWSVVTLTSYRSDAAPTCCGPAGRQCPWTATR